MDLNAKIWPRAQKRADGSYLKIENAYSGWVPATKQEYDKEMSDYQKRINPQGSVQGGNYGVANTFEGFLEPSQQRNAAPCPVDPSPSTAPGSLTLPTDSQERKNYPMLSGCLNYFPAALAGVSKVSKIGNDKHNPGQPLHHARAKSTDHGDCIVRHLTDVQDILARINRNEAPVSSEELLLEVSSLAWRALAYSQELHEIYGTAPMAPGAK